MSDKLGIFVLAALGQFDSAMRHAEGNIEIAAMAAARGAAGAIASDGRADIAAAGFGRKWQSALHVKVFPDRASSTHPTIQVRHKIPYAGIFETGGSISGAPLLWLPLNDAPFARGTRHMTPARYRKATGNRLYLIRRGGRPPLLGIRTKKAGRATIQPMWIGFRSVSVPDKFDIHEIAEKHAAEVPKAFAEALARDQG